MPAGEGDPGSSLRGDRRRLLTGGAALVGFAIPVALYLWLISADAIDMVRADQWFDIDLIRRSTTGALSLSDLWAQHGENRVFFQNLITLGLGRFAHDNVLVDVYLSALFLLGATALVILAHRRRSPATPWFAYVPVAFLLLSLAQWLGTLYGYAVGWYLIILCLAAALFFLDRPVPTRMALAAAAAAAVVASFSSFQGLLVWPVGLALLLQRRRARSSVLAWVVVGVATAGVYFYHWDPRQGGGTSYSLHHPVAVLEFFLFAVGDIVGVPLPDHPSGGQYGVLAFGIVVVGLGIWAIVRFGLRADVASARPLGVALIWFGLLFAAAAAAGRASMGLNLASFSLFVLYDLLTLVGSYLVFLDARVPLPEEAGAPAARNPCGARWLAGIPLAVVGVLVVVQVAMGTTKGISNGRAYLNYQVTGAVVTAHIARAPDGLVTSQLGAGYESASFIRGLVAYARAHRLSQFSTGANAAYATRPLPVNTTRPTTAVAKPAPGERLRGDVFVLASATDPYGVTRVEFVVTGGPAHVSSTVVSQGVRTSFGWLGGWNTTSVPDGTYVLRSVAHAPDDMTATSKPVAVTVAN